MGNTDPANRSTNEQPQHYLQSNGTQSGEIAAHICHLKTHFDWQKSGSLSESCTLKFLPVNSYSLLLTLTHFICIWVAEEWSFPRLNYEQMYALRLVQNYFFIFSRGWKILLDGLC